MIKTPVLFLIFNRPDVTFKVFEEIRKVQPKQLFIAADGPREDKEGEMEKCQMARSVVNKIDWKCEVKTLFRDKNLGCKIAVSSAINWFFENVEEGIILEDDCLPDQSFFTFCTILLDKYRHNKSVMHIGGNNFQNGKIRGDASYFFTIYPHIWGWATWRRAWLHYDINMKNLDVFLSSDYYSKLFQDSRERGYWKKKFIDTSLMRINTWDYQWAYSVWNAHGISISPNLNLVSNIGFNNDATHTNESSHLANIPSEKVGELKHPVSIYVNSKADKFTFNNTFSPPPKKKFKNLYSHALKLLPNQFKEKLKAYFENI